MIPRKAQRLALRSPIGSLLKGQHARIPRPRVVDGDRDEPYLKLVRQCPCLHCGMDPAGEAAHVRMASGYHRKASGAGKKPADRWALPLCGEHHRLAADAQHKRSERAFWAELGINPLAACKRLRGKRGDLVAMRAATHLVIGERSP